MQLNSKDSSEGTMTVQALDWGRDLDQFSEKYDIILGADIIYIEETFPSLLSTMKHFLQRGSVLYLACRVRYERDARFLDLMRQNFAVTIAHRDSDRDITVYSAQKLQHEEL